MIQNAAKENYFQLFPEELLASILDAFVINQPMIGEVGGDGFWVHQTAEYLFVAAFDCMGHGYGASMMTRVYTQALEKTIGDLNHTDPGDILKSVHEQIRTQFHGKPKKHIGSGADIGVLRISKNARALAYAGAKMDLMCISDGHCEIIKADRMQLGELFDYPHTHTTNVIQMSDTKSMSFYMSSDGFVDMIGGDENKRFGRKRVKSLLSKLATMSMSDQKQAITYTLKSWLGTNEPNDDLLIIGLKL